VISRSSTRGLRQIQLQVRETCWNLLLSKYGIFFNFPHNVRRNPVPIFFQKTVQPNLATSQRGGMLEAGLVIIHKRTT
jgi:hypothetical protein